MTRGQQICIDFYWKRKLAPVRKFLDAFYKQFKIKR